MIRTGTEERPCEDGDRRAPSTSQGGRPQGKLKRLTLDLWILSSRTARKLTSVVLSTLFVVLGYGSPIKLTQSLVMIVVTPSFSKAINGYVWFPGGVFSKWNCCYCLLSWTFSFFFFFFKGRKNCFISTTICEPVFQAIKLSHPLRSLPHLRCMTAQ